jgi:hypothetical protein
MSTSYGHDAAPHAPCKIDHFLYLGNAPWAYIELGAGVERACPGVVNVRLGCAKGDVGIGAVELNVEARRHREAGQG